MERPDEAQVNALRTQFQEITGTDPMTAETMLEAHGWNLTNAMNTHFSFDSAPQPSSAATPPNTTSTGLRQRATATTTVNSGNNDQANSSTNNNNTNSTNDESPTSAVPLWKRILDTLMRFALLPIDLIRYFFVQSTRFGWGFFSSLMPGGSEPLPLRGELQKEFESKYSSRHPQLFDGTLVEAMNFAKKELKYMLVVIHNPKSDQSNKYLSETITSENFVLFCNDNLAFWAASTADKQGVAACNSLRVATFPFTTLIAFVEGQMKIVWRQGGFMSTPTLLEKLALLMEQYQPALISEQQERSRRVFDREIRQQQEQEYEASLVADREREAAKAAEITKQELDEKLREEKQLEEETQAVEKLKNREASLDLKRARLPKPPVAGDPSVKLRFKFPNGKRLERVFSPEHQLQSVFDFIDINAEDHEISAEFSILTQYPMTKLEGMDRTLADVGLKGGGQNLNIRDDNA